MYYNIITKRVLIFVITQFIIGLQVFGQKADCPMVEIRTQNGDFRDTVLDFNLSIPSSTSKPIDTNANIVWFIHGNGGNDGSLSTLAEEVKQSFNCNTFTPTYTNQQKSGFEVVLGVTKDDIDKDIDALNPIYKNNSPERNILVGHSLGGIVARSMEDYYARVFPNESLPFGRLIVMGAPNMGTKMVRNEQKMYDWVEDGCKKLGSSNISQAMHVNIFNLKGKISEVKDKICTVIGDNVLPAVIHNDQFSSSAQVTDEGSQFITDLNAKNQLSAIPRLALYGNNMDDQGNNINEPLMVRTFYWMANEPNNILNDNPNSSYYNTNFYSASNDKTDEAAASFNETRNKYETRLETEKWYRDDLLEKLRNPLCWVQPWCMIDLNIRYNNSRWVVNDHQNAVDWLNSANDQWKFLIGALEYENVPSGYTYQCECYLKSGDPNQTFVTMSSTSPITYNDCEGTNAPRFICNRTTNTHWSVRKKYYDSDGIILAKSTVGVDNWSAKPRKLYKNTHLQMRNSPETEEQLRNKIFEEGEDGWKFKLNK